MHPDPTPTDPAPGDTGATRRPEPARPRETLVGDRLCMQCLHPLLGRTIERDAGTGLLYVRCGECGTPSALFEYPTVTPWINRIKAVVASTLVAFAIASAIALAGASGGFSGASAALAAEESGESLLASYLRDVPRPAVPADPTALQQNSRYAAADEAWLQSDAGRAAISASRRSWNALLPFLLLQAVGIVVTTPFAVLLGIGFMRHSALRRAIWCALPAVLGSGIALATHMVNAQHIGVMVGRTRSWVQVAESVNLPFFATVSFCVLVGCAALSAVLAPVIAASIARLILPPRDRRLVGWLWEWRGKSIPKN